jgi:hypothetical protein
MTQFLYNTYPVNMQIDQAGPDLLLKPGITEAFIACGLLDGCDLNIEEVNWRCVVMNWNLPVRIQKSGKNPYRMGDKRRQEDALAKYRADAEREFDQFFGGHLQ